MIEKFLVFMTVIGAVTSVKCYSYLAVSKSEFIDSAETCKTDGACVTVTYKDLIYTDCADDCLAETTKIAKETMKTIAEEGGVILKETDVEVGCCKADLCSKPTAVAKPAGTQCYEFQGELSEMKANATRCDYGSYCLTASVRNFIVARCVNECSDVNKKITEVAVEAEFDDKEQEAELTEGEVKSECCTGHLCNDWYMENGGTTTQTEESTTKATVASTKPTVPATTTVLSTEAALPSTTPTESSTESSVPTTKPTVPSTESSFPTTKPTVLSTEATVPSTKPTVPSTEATVPSTKPTVPSTDATVPSTKPTVPSTNGTAPSTKPTVATTEGTVPTTKPTESPTKATVTSTNPTVASSKYTVLSPEPTVALVKPTVATIKPTVVTNKPTVATKKPTIATTKSTMGTTSVTSGTTKGEGSGADTGSIIGASTTTNAADMSLSSLPLYSLGLLSIVYSMQ